MRKLMFITIVCAFLAVPSMAGLTVKTTNGYGIWQTGQGGEFTLLPGGWNPLPYYVGSTKDQGTMGTFQTFCVEHLEYVYPWTTFDVVLNDKAVMGGTAGGDPLSIGTAWLYHDFQKETLAGYDYTAAGRNASAAALQNTIWWLEGEAGDPGAGNIFRQAVIAKFTAAGAMADNDGAYDVAVLNLWVVGKVGDYTMDASGNYLYLRQDMLVCTPVPAAVLLGMLGLSVAGLKLRKFA